MEGYIGKYTPTVMEINENIKEEVLRQLEPMFEKAEREGLWLQSESHDMLFSPKELHEMHDENTFLWGALNWELKSPQDELEMLKRRKLNAEINLADFIERMEK